MILSVVALSLLGAIAGALVSLSESLKSPPQIESRYESCKRAVEEMFPDDLVQVFGVKAPTGEFARAWVAQRTYDCVSGYRD